jgi:hypothetical protein
MLVQAASCWPEQFVPHSCGAGPHFSVQESHHFCCEMFVLHQRRCILVC